MRSNQFCPFWLWGKQAATPPRLHRGKWINWRGQPIRLRKFARTLKAANLNRALARSRDVDFMLGFVHPRRIRTVC